MPSLLHHLHLHPIPSYPHSNSIPSGLLSRGLPPLNRASLPLTASYAAAPPSPPATKPNTLSSCFARYGFSLTQANKIMSRDPWFLSAEPERTIEPKLDYFLHYGFSQERLIRLICRDPNILCASLFSRIIPNLNLLERLLGSKPPVMKACERGPWLLRNDLCKGVAPVVLELRSFGVPDERIAQMFVKNPLVMSRTLSDVRKGLDTLKDLGMRTETSTFGTALIAVILTKEMTWERKMRLYMTFGWSKRDVMTAFSRQPTCMMLSDEKITKAMTFFTKTLNWDPDLIVKRVALLTVSLESRIMPRCAVMDLLGERGVWNGKPSMYTVLCISEKRFEERFVESYKEEVPGLYDAYLGRTEFSGFRSI